MTKTIYKIHDRKTDEIVSVYSQFNGSKTEFNSVREARSSNCNDTYEDEAKYKICAYEVSEVLIDNDVQESNAPCANCHGYKKIKYTFIVDNDPKSVIQECSDCSGTGLKPKYKQEKGEV